jgi:hypothetical protein
VGENPIEHSDNPGAPRPPTASGATARRVRADAQRNIAAVYRTVLCLSLRDHAQDLRLAAEISRNGQSIHRVGHHPGRLAVSIDHSDATGVVLGEPLDHRPPDTAATARHHNCSILKLHSGEAKQTIGGVPSTAFRPALFG